eukprot:XP_025009809.1 uncharacterized protein LOC101748692 isoform X2 [Gallus gallus]
MAEETEDVQPAGGQGETPSHCVTAWKEGTARNELPASTLVTVALLPESAPCVSSVLGASIICFLRYYIPGEPRKAAARRFPADSDKFWLLSRPEEGLHFVALHLTYPPWSLACCPAQRTATWCVPKDSSGRW